MKLWNHIFVMGLILAVIFVLTAPRIFPAQYKSALTIQTPNRIPEVSLSAEKGKLEENDFYWGGVI